MAEKKTKTCVKAGELVDEYEQARRQELGVATDKPVKTQPQKKQSGEQKKCDFCGRLGHLE